MDTHASPGREKEKKKEEGIQFASRVLKVGCGPSPEACCTLLERLGFNGLIDCDSLCD